GFISQDQLLKAREAMRAIVADHLPGTMATITFEDGNPAMPPTKGNLALLAVEDSVSRALGQGPVEALDPGRRGGGDISYVSDYVDALDGLGVKGMRSHTPDERVDLRSIVPATERAALLIYRLTRQRGKGRRPIGKREQQLASRGRMHGPAAADFRGRAKQKSGLDFIDNDDLGIGENFECCGLS